MEVEIRKALGAYLAGRMELDDLRMHLASVTWDNPGAPDLAHAMEQAIDDASSGHLTRYELDLRLRELDALAQPVLR